MFEIMNKSGPPQLYRHQTTTLCEKSQTITGLSLMFKSELFTVTTVNLREVAFRFLFDFNLIRF